MCILDMTHAYLRGDTSPTTGDLFICGSWLVRMWFMTHLYIGYDSCVPERGHNACHWWLIHLWVVTRSYVVRGSFMRHDSYIPPPTAPRVFIHMWFVNPSNVVRGSFHMGHDSCIPSPAAPRVTLSYVVRETFKSGSWLIYIWDMTHTYCHLPHYEWLIHRWLVTYSHVARNSFKRGSWLF